MTKVEAIEKAKISIYNEDCLQALKAMADNQFDLAIVDPPYGIGASAEFLLIRCYLSVYFFVFVGGKIF